MGVFSKIFGDKKDRCLNHPNKKSIGICASCKQPFCEDCLIEISEYYCCISEPCRESLNNIIEKSKHNAIASSAKDLAENTMALLNGEFEDAFNWQKDDKIDYKNDSIYNEIVFLSLHNLMNIIPKYVDEEERDIFFGEIYVAIRNILIAKYSDSVESNDFQKYFDSTFKERRQEYCQFTDINEENFSEDPLYMAFGKKIIEILDQPPDLENDANIQTLYTFAFTPLVPARELLHSIKTFKID